MNVGEYDLNESMYRFMQLAGMSDSDILELANRHLAEQNNAAPVRFAELSAGEQDEVRKALGKRAGKLFEAFGVFAKTTAEMITQLHGQVVKKGFSRAEAIDLLAPALPNLLPSFADFFNAPKPGG